MNHIQTDFNHPVKSAYFHHFCFWKFSKFNFYDQKYYVGQHFGQHLFSFWKAYICTSHHPILFPLLWPCYLCIHTFVPRPSYTYFGPKTSLADLGIICWLNVDQNDTIWKSVQNSTFYIYKSSPYLLPIKRYSNICENSWSGSHLRMRLSCVLLCKCLKRK